MLQNYKALTEAFSFPLEKVIPNWLMKGTLILSFTCLKESIKALQSEKYPLVGVWKESHSEFNIFFLR